MPNRPIEWRINEELGEDAMKRNTSERARSSRSILLAATMAAGIVATPGPALAQQSNDAADAVDEIIVTARRREESQQSVPISVAAYSAESLEQRSVDDLADLSGASPNLYVSSGPSGGQGTGAIYMRGVGQTDFIATADPGVGVYVDGVYLSRTIGNVLDLVDIERVEVLRGPQGTLFGRNTIGGAISITTRVPGNEFGGDVEVSLGEFERRDARLRLNAPLIEDRLAGSLAVVRRTRDGYGSRPLAGEEMGDINLWAARGALNFTPTSDFDLVLAVDAARRDEHAVVHSPTDIIETDPNFVLLQAYNTFIATPFGSPLLNVTPACPDGVIPPAPSPVATSCSSPVIGTNPYSSQATSFNVSDLDVLGGSANATWDLGALTLRSITAYRTQESTSGADFDGSPLSFSEQIVNIETDTFSQEVQLFGEAFDSRLSWLVGAYYSRESSDTDFTFLVAQPGFGPSINLLTTLETTSYAAFASGTWRLTDRLSATAGVRYSRDERDTEDNANFVSNPYLGGAPSSFYAAPGPGPFPGVPNFFPFGTIVTGADSWENVSPRLSVEYQASEGAFLYASVAEGYKSGSFNGRPLTGSLAPTAYGPEQVTTYELGWKLDLFDRRLRLNTSVFNTSYDDIQVTILVADGPLVNTPTVNAGQAEVRGVEFELQAAPTEALRLDASVGYVDASFTKLNAPSSFPGAVIPFGTDAEFAQTPEWTASLGAQYSFDLAGNGVLILRGDANYRDHVYFNVPNLDEASQDGFTLFNARATYESPDGAWRLAVFGTNLADETYKTFAFGAFGIVTSYYGAPREWGVSLSRSF